MQMLETNYVVIYKEIYYSKTREEGGGGVRLLQQVKYGLRTKL